jgi:3-isopropylmalate dehydratase small subunit
MKAFTQLTGLAAPIDRANIDTDAIIPKQFLKSIKRSGFGPYLFDEWRYNDHGEPGMDCLFSTSRVIKAHKSCWRAKILVAAQAVNTHLGRLKISAFV